MAALFLSQLYLGMQSTLTWKVLAPTYILQWSYFIYRTIGYIGIQNLEPASFMGIILSLSYLLRTTIFRQNLDKELDQLYD